MNFADRLQVVERLDSTNSALLALPREQFVHGSSILALEQTSGRGRYHREWVSKRGGMYLSIGLTKVNPSGMALLGALSCIRLLEEFGLNPRLRWPNDVLVGGKKISGVLPVTRYQGNVLERIVLGIGLNISQSLEDFPDGLGQEVTSLAKELGERSWSVVAVAKTYLGWLQRELKLYEAKAGLSGLCSRSETYLEGLDQKGHMVLVDCDGLPESSLRLGSVLGLASDGALLLEGYGRLDALGSTQKLRFESHPTTFTH